MTALRTYSLAGACLFAATTLFALLPPARAATYSWQTAVGDWSVASNWGTPSPPGNDTVCIANGGTAEVTTTGDICGTLTVGSSGGTGTIQVLGGNLSPSLEQIGDGGTGAVVQSGGTNGNSDLDLEVGYGAGGNGAYALSGSGLLTSLVEFIGATPSIGVFVQSGGTNSVPGDGDLYVGGSGTGSYTLTGSGMLSVGTTLTLTDDQHGAGTFALSGSAKLTAHNEEIGNSDPGTFNQSGGTNSCGNLLLSLIGRGGTYNLNGGLLITSTLMDSPGADFNFNGGTLQAAGSFSTAMPMTLGTSGGGATFETAGFTVTDSGSLSGAGSLTKAGSGTLILTATNSYSGATIINGGTLIVGGSLASAVAVGGGATLGGSGSAASATIDAGGVLAPGSTQAPGAIDLSGTLSLLSGAILDYRLGTPADSDTVFMPGGTLILGGQQFTDFVFSPQAGFGPGEYTLIEAESIRGGLGTSVSGTVGGRPATLTVDGSDLALNVVPEPSELVIFIAAGIALRLLFAASRKNPRRRE